MEPTKPFLPEHKGADADPHEDSQLPVTYQWPSHGLFDVVKAAVLTALTLPLLPIIVPLVGFACYKRSPYWTRKISNLKAWQLIKHPNSLYLQLFVTPINSLYTLFDLTKTYKSDLLQIFQARQAIFGNTFVWNNAFTMTSHADVRAILMGSQVRAYTVAGQMIAGPKAMHPSLLVFLSNPTSKYDRLRSFLQEEVFHSPTMKANLNNFPDAIKAILQRWINSGDPSTKSNVLKMVGSAAIKAALDIDVTEDEEKLYLDYEAATQTIVMAKWMNFLDCNRSANNVFRIRRAYAAVIRRSAVYKAANEKAKKMGISELIDDGLDLVICDAFLFAGLLGTYELVRAVLVALKDTEDRVALYRSNPDVFILETTRLDPSVSGVVAVLQDNRDVHIGSKKVQLPPGTMVYANIRMANHDAKVWGEDVEQFNTGRDYANLLSWNGMLDQGPRICPGRSLSFLICRHAIDAFLQSR